MTTLRAGLIQMSLKMDASRAPVEIREAMMAAHVPFIEEAARRGVQVVCMQEIFNQSIFLPHAEIRGGSPARNPCLTDRRSRCCVNSRGRHSMVIVAPVYELEYPGVAAPRQYRRGN